MGTVKKIAVWIRSWILIVAIVCGVGSYFLYVDIPWLDCTHAFMLQAVEIVQPLLIFAMLFVTFCRVNPRHLRLCRWHWWLLGFQCLMFLALGGVAMLLPSHNGFRIVIEGAMICFICPVATAGAVVTRKLGGNASHITTYTILINLVAALLIPLVVPLLHPENSMSTWSASVLILGKVFPLLLLPLILAFLVRQLLPKIHFYVSRQKNLSFYLWVVALFLAMAVTTRFIMHASVPLSVELGLVVVAGISCVMQFAVGWHFGNLYGDRVTAGQSLGQKNTVLAIWLGYTFFNPVTSLAGGFYSIFHNLINSLQLNRYARRKEQK